MKIIYTTLNAKYIHTNNAIRLLYQITKNEYPDTSFKEFTIKDDLDNISTFLSMYDLIGFSCYIWNIEYIKQLSLRIRILNPNISIIAGGPEVSYDPDPFKPFFDYIVSGEGENIIIPLIDYLTGKNDVLPNCVTTNKILNKEVNCLTNLNDVPDINDLFTDDDYNNRIIYMEFSRGCPFKCSYCLSQLECNVRNFDNDTLDKKLSFLQNKKIKMVKFLDRSFNINPQKFLQIVEKLSISGRQFQFEIEPNLLTDEVVDYLSSQVKPGIFRLEIGIQTLNNITLKSVDRYQNNIKILEYIKKIIDNKRVDIHVDLLAGLPYDTIEQFILSFNTIFLLQCSEVQLGFLKMLRGTKIRKEATKYNYVYDELPPYEFIYNDFLSIADKERIKKAEIGLNFLWNDKRAVNTIKTIIRNENSINWFSLFEEFGVFYHKIMKLEEIYKYISTLPVFINYLDDLKYDYLLKNRIRIRRWWPFEDLIQLKNEIKNKFSFNEKQLKNTFITSYYKGFIIIFYDKNHELIII